MDSHFAVLDKRTAKLSKERVTLQHQDWTTVILNSKKTKATKAPTAPKLSQAQQRDNKLLKKADNDELKHDKDLKNYEPKLFKKSKFEMEAKDNPQHIHSSKM